MLFIVTLRRHSDQMERDRRVLSDCETNAVRAAVNEFFSENPDDKVKLLAVTSVNMVGDLEYAGAVEDGALVDDRWAAGRGEAH